MDIKQLVTGNPKTGFYPVTQDTITVIELNKSVMNLTNGSSSEEIIAAFDNLESFQALIAEVRNPQNICSGILVNETPEDKRVGKYEATIIANTDAETLHVRWVEIDKIIALSITNTDGTMSCIRNENNVGGDKTNVLILSLENDLANGQKDSPVTAEVSTALKDAISTGKACVIKSANSDILANLQQIGDNVTIIMEQISRVGQTFVAVNTTITVNTVTNIISDYQTGAIVLETEGDGSKFLSNNGTYKEIPQPNLSNYLAKNNTTEFTPSGDYNPATKKYVDDSMNYIYIGPVPITIDRVGIEFVINDEVKDELLELYRTITSDIIQFIIVEDSNGTMTYGRTILNIYKKYVNRNNNTATISFNTVIGDIIYYGELEIHYDGITGDYYNKFIINTAIPVVNQRIVTEFEYSALGDSVNTDNILYFVTPDA